MHGVRPDSSATSPIASSITSSRFSGANRAAQTSRSAPLAGSSADAPRAVQLVFESTSTAGGPARRSATAWCAEGESTRSASRQTARVMPRRALSRRRGASCTRGSGSPVIARWTAVTAGARNPPHAGPRRKKVWTVCSVGIPRSRPSRRAVAASPCSECVRTRSVPDRSISAPRSRRVAASARITGRPRRGTGRVGATS
ncbi:hypothetical protein BC477_08640 [Clavibacter michiganensis subsp. michiganensis]|uniref:Uncharacterized protein n=1 Tax=Clavibacter michiganensis subsp. michiganensis TaxID=33013 RepID=A0A251XMW9_CLAMM|nr:hypothetical protein BC477_08640 [Clavibacter michiganensis subsp. michiganensis]OUE04791.1 hypothetical protein CMMCAS07_07570 [Clavibacter michiganensis subsp. michiganensis]